MSAADIVLLALGCFFVVKGAFKGLSGEVMSLVAILGGFYCSLRWRETIADAVADMTGISGAGASVVAMASVFLCVYLACTLCLKIVRRILKFTSLTWLDKILGAGAGLLKTYLISMAVLIAGMLLAPVTGTAWCESSRVLTAAAATWPYMTSVLQGAGVDIDTDKLIDEARSFIMRSAPGVSSGPIPIDSSYASPIDESGASEAE